MDLLTIFGIIAVAVASLLFVARMCATFACGMCTCKGRLDGRTVIITGANTGIGKETASVLADRGARVILACRNMEAATAAADSIRKAIGRSAQLVTMKLDLSDLQSVRSFAKSFLEQEQQLDILINNAGVMWCPNSCTAQGFDTQYGVNHLGHFLLTNLLLPLMKRTGTRDAPSRIISVSSLAHRRGRAVFKLEKQEDAHYNSWSTYSNSKLMNILFTRELTHRLRESSVDNVVSTCLHPGAIATDLQRHALARVGQTLSQVLLPVNHFVMKTPVQGAQTTIHLALKPNPMADAGKYFSDCKAIPCAKAARDDDAAGRLWAVSEEACREYLG